MALPTNSGSGDRTNQGGLPPAGRPRPASGGLPAAPPPGRQQGLPTPPQPQRRQERAPEPQPEAPRPAPRPAPQASPPAAPPQEPSYYRDDSFEQIPLEELEEDYEDEQDLAYEPPPARPLPPREAPAPAYEPEPTPEPAPAPADDLAELMEAPAPPPRRAPAPPEEAEPEESNFVNAKTKKLSPFGGSKSDSKKRKKGSSNTFDSRENRKAQARAVQIGALTLLVGIVGFGAWNAVNPPQGVSEEEVAAIVASGQATQNFPFERGEAFAEDFMTAYLNITPNEIEAGGTDPELAYYYTGTLGTTAESTLAVNGDFAQRTVNDPKVFERVPVSDHSAAFVVGALVEPLATEGAPVDESLDSSAGAKWVFYNVNVYYNEKTDTMTATPDSPTLVPPKQVGSSESLPEEKLPGTGDADEDLAADVESVVYGFVQAFALSSPNDHAALDQYLIANPDASLLQGLGGQYELAGDPATAIEYTAYPAAPESKDVRLDLTVTWQDAAPSGGTASYRSRYFVELLKGSDGKYLVSRVSPKYYTMLEE